MSDLKKKNKYDLDYSTYSQFFNTIIIIFVTISIGMLLTVLTGQIKISMNTPFIFTMLIFIVALIFSIYSLIKLYNKMEETKRNIDKLKI